MIYLTLSDGYDVLVKVSEIVLVKRHGDKTLIYTTMNEAPLCTSNSFDEVKDCILFRSFYISK